MLDPIGKYVAVFPDYYALMSKRGKKLLDYDRLRSTVKKLVEKPSSDPAKLAQAEQEASQAKVTYETINRQLKLEIPAVVDMRVPYLTPSFEAIVKSQLTFNQAAFYRLDGLKQAFPTGAEKGLEGRAENVLHQLRSLSILKDKL